MTRQRRHGQTILVWPAKVVVDNRGNRTVSADMSGPGEEHRAWVIPERATRAEVPGQQQVDVYRLGVDDGIQGLDLWARIKWRGTYWDVEAPPQYHHGTRHNRHWTVMIRKRPLKAPGGDP